MLEVYKKVLTKKGQQLHAKNLAGDQITFTRFQFGSGSYTGTEADSYFEAMTALKTPKDSFPFSKVEVVSKDSKSTCKLTLAASNAVDGVEAGYYITEIGEYAKGNDGVEVLYSILVTKPDRSEWFPKYDERTPATLKYYDYISVGNAENVTLQVGGGGVALQEDLEELEGRVTNLEMGAAACIGIKRKCQTDGTPQSSTKWERWGQYADAVVEFATGNDDVQNDLMSKWPYNLLRPCNLPLNSDEPVAYMGDPEFDWYGKTGVAAGTSVMLQVPTEMYLAHWYEKDNMGQNWEYKCVADTERYPGSVYVKDLMKRADGTKTDFFYYPIFLGSFDDDGHFVSVAGVTPKYNTVPANFRTAAKSNGSNWQLLDIWAWEIMSDLAEIMSADANFKTTYGQGYSGFGSTTMASLTDTDQTNKVTISNSHQSKISVGMSVCVGNALWNASVCENRQITNIEASDTVDNAIEVTLSGEPFHVLTTSVMWRCAQITGSTINMASPCGSAGANDGLHSNRMLYIEDFFGSLHTSVDGINLKFNSDDMCLEMYACTDPSKYSDAYGDGYALLPQKMALNPDALNNESSGYIKKNFYFKDYPILEFPETVGGGAGSNTYIAAYAWRNKNGQRPFVGGSFPAGAQVSPRSRDCNNGFGHSFWLYGSRPLKR